MLGDPETAPVEPPDTKVGQPDTKQVDQVAQHKDDHEDEQQCWVAEKVKFLSNHNGEAEHSNHGTHAIQREHEIVLRKEQDN